MQTERLSFLICFQQIRSLAKLHPWLEEAKPLGGCQCLCDLPPVQRWIKSSFANNNFHKSLAKSCIVCLNYSVMRTQLIKDNQRLPVVPKFCLSWSWPRCLLLGWGRPREAVTSGGKFPMEEHPAASRGDRRASRLPGWMRHLQRQDERLQHLGCHRPHLCHLPGFRLHGHGCWCQTEVAKGLQALHILSSALWLSHKSPSPSS